MGIIKVQGKGKVSVEPDMVILSFDIKEEAKKYLDCVNGLNQRTAQLRDDMEKAGFVYSIFHILLQRLIIFFCILD